MKQEEIRTPQAPQPGGPYSQAIRHGQYIYLSGQVGVDPSTRMLVAEDVESQTHQALQNLDSVLKAAGASLKQVVKTTVFLTELSEFKAMNRVYSEYFPEMPPARSAVQVAGLPGAAKVEIEAVAFIP